jgi:L-aminopeptidase/D-esterase-like protein
LTNNSITLVKGIKVGHATDTEGITGCTVILCEDGAVGGIDQRGGAPGTRETDLLDPVNHVDRVNAILLAGGSAFGLEAATGVMRYLKEKGKGYNARIAKIPIVPAAILFDLGIGDKDSYPDAEMGYQACVNASTNVPAQGSVGAGTGATVGKLLGPTQMVKSGIGSAGMNLGGGIQVGALIAVNALGDVIDPGSNTILAGARTITKGPIKIGEGPLYADSLVLMKNFIGRTTLGLASGSNTVIGVVVTNARLDKRQATKVAQMAQNGLARTIRPANTMMDGDTLFCLATGKKSADVNLIGAYAALMVEQAIQNAVHEAASLGGVPAVRDLTP